jgi:O-antigen/teichoic acid export membrane protein
MNPGAEEIKQAEEASDKAEVGAYGRNAAQLTIALGLGGVLTYVFFIIASRTLTEDEYGEIVVLWSIVFLLASTLFRPIEQLLARTLAERDQAGAPSGDALRTAAVIQGGLATTALVVLLLLRGPLQDELFSANPNLYWAMLVSLTGFGVAYYLRGFLAGRGHFTLYAALLISEVLLRLGFAVIVALGIAGGTNLIAVGIAIAPFGGLLVIPLLASRSPTHALEPGTARPGADLTLGTGGAFTAAVLLMMLSEQILVSSGALFVRAAEGAAAAGFMFNILLVARAPLVLFQAVAASLLPHLTRLRARTDSDSDDAFKESLQNTMLLIVAFAMATTLGVLAIGPQVMQLAFGDNFDYDRVGLAIVAVGMGFYLVAAALNQATLAQGQAHRAASRWALCATVFVVCNLIGPGNPFRAVEIGFAGCAALLAGLLYLVYASPAPRADDLVEPGSSEELQARLATSDEIA